MEGIKESILFQESNVARIGIIQWIYFPENLELEWFELVQDEFMSHFELASNTLKYLPTCLPSHKLTLIMWAISIKQLTIILKLVNK